MAVFDNETGFTLQESYQLPDGRVFDNQRDAEIALNSLGRVRWADASTYGSSVSRFIVGGIEPASSAVQIHQEILRMLQDSDCTIRVVDGKIVEVSVPGDR